MRRSHLSLFLIGLSLFLIGSLAVSCAQSRDEGSGKANVPPSLEADIKDIRAHLGWEDPDGLLEQLRYLRRLGEKRVFAAFEAMLATPKGNQEIRYIFLALYRLSGDRQRFIEPALRRLTDPDAHVRGAAARLLGVIGTPAEASTLVALLSDEASTVMIRAATALASIGSEREVIALDVWLRGTSQRDKAPLREFVKECREKLKKRLDEAHAKKGN